MSSIHQRHRKEPQSRDLALLNLYHISGEELINGRGLFGPGHRLALANQIEENVDGLYDLTLKNLAWHFGFGLSSTRREYLLQSGMSEREMKALEEQCKAYFYQSTLLPTRQYVENTWHFSFFCASNMRVETNEKTGRPRIEHNGPRTLMAIPHSVQVGSQCKIPENTLKLLAPIAIHVLQSELGRGSVRDTKVLRRRLDGWFEYEPRLKKPFQDALKISGPCIASQKPIQQLLIGL